MKPTTKFCLAMKLPGQSGAAHEILCAQEFESKDYGDGNLLIEDATIMTAAKAMIVVLGTVTHTKTLAFGICRSVSDAEKFFTVRAQGKDSGVLPTDTFGDLGDFANNFFELNPEAADPNTLMFQNPDVSNVRFSEVFEAKEYMAVRALREADDRHILTLEECVKIAHDYASAFPDVAAHDPRWDGKPIIEWLNECDPEWAIRGDSIEPTVIPRKGLPRMSR
jgi:hypothetical protein